MASTHRKAPGNGAGAVQSLSVPDWVRKYVEEANAEAPAGYVNAEDFARIIRKPVRRAREFLAERATSGELERIKFKGVWYYGKKK